MANKSKETLKILDYLQSNMPEEDKKPAELGEEDEDMPGVVPPPDRKKKKKPLTAEDGDMFDVGQAPSQITGGN